jgi:hypothetical protein
VLYEKHSPTLDLVDEHNLLSDENGELIKGIIEDCYFKICNDLDIDLSQGDQYVLKIEDIPVSLAGASHTPPSKEDSYGYITISSDFISRFKSLFDNYQQNQQEVFPVYLLTLKLISLLAHESYHRFQFISDPNCFISEEYVGPDVHGTSYYLSQKVEIEALNFSRNYMLRAIEIYSHNQVTLVGKIISDCNEFSSMNIELL